MVEQSSKILTSEDKATNSRKNLSSITLSFSTVLAERSTNAEKRSH